MTTRDDVLRTLDAYVSDNLADLQAKLDTANSTIANDAVVLDAVKTADAKALSDLKATDAATLAALQAAFDQYKKDHPDGSTPPPPPPTTGRVVGMNYRNPVETVNVNYEKKAKAARIYVNAGQTNIKNESEFVRAYNNGVRVFVLSWKDTSTSTIGPMLDSVPDDCKVYGIFHHEPENDGSSMTPAQWRDLQAKHMPVVRAHGGIPTVCLMAWTLSPSSGRKVSDWVLPKGLVDVYLFDYYPDVTKSDQQAGVVSSIKNSLSTFGVSRWGIGEYGVANGNSNGVSFINNFKSLSISAEVICYWSSQVASSGTVNYRFTDSTANAWFA